MAQVYTFTDSNGEVRLRAEINPAPGGSFDGSNQWAQYGGETILSDSVAATLDWGGLISGTALLDLSSTTLPTVVTAGVYAVTVNVAAAAHAGGYASLQLDIDQTDIDMQGVTTIPLNAGFAVVPCVTVVSYCPAGGIMRVRGLQTSGGAQTWDPAMIVQRVA